MHSKLSIIITICFFLFFCPLNSNGQHKIDSRVIVGKNNKTEILSADLSLDIDGYSISIKASSGREIDKFEIKQVVKAEFTDYKNATSLTFDGYYKGQNGSITFTFGESLKLILTIVHKADSKSKVIQYANEYEDSKALESEIKKMYIELRGSEF